LNRRDLLRAAAFGSSAVLLGRNLAPQLWAATGSALPLRMAGYDFDRTAALADGRIGVAGCATKFELAAIGDINTATLSGAQPWDVTEIGLHPFMLAHANDGFRDFTLLPVFPLRVFRHKSIFIRNDRGIETPADLRGKRIATPGYSSTSLTWIRGMLQDEYGVSPRDVEWVQSRKDSSADLAGKVSRQETMIPECLSVSPGPLGLDESDLLETGQVDALFHAAEPRAYSQGHPKVARLFPDYRATERAYFAKTGIFPIMHAVAIRKSLADANPWLPGAVFDAYVGARDQAYQYLAKKAWAYSSLPWAVKEVEDTRQLMGENFWPYGLGPANRKVLETLSRYSHEQGLASRRLGVNELFHQASLEFKDPG
jgi:4,5-dihydroxyphthalate decarboxylase